MTHTSVSGAKIWRTTLAACCLAAIATAFSLDTLHPVILQGPITEPNAARGQSYFGYSVALTNSWVLVGAPRANSTLGFHDIPNTGAVYKCSLERLKCEEIVLDKSGNDRYGQAPNIYQDYKEGGWVGSAMDANSSPGGKVSVCGHRWMNQIDGMNYYGNGVCYWLDNDIRDSNATKVVPLVDRTKQLWRQREKNDKYFYGYGQAGTAVHFAKDGRELLMGAPGVYEWKGTVIRLSDATDFFVGPNQRRRRRRRRQADPTQTLSIFNIPNPHYFPDAIRENDYFGYSVGSGNFLEDGKTYYVAGAPRAAYGKGKVFVFDFPLNEVEAPYLPAERVGTQVGEYFGSVVLGADVTGDERAELLVGAPLFSAPQGQEEGRVYVYPNLGRGRIADEPLLLAGDRVRNARFGSALASLGDLDLDGYNDIAVGAPYEEEQRGAVYIYLGGASGLNPTHSQKILASQLSDQLFGFGISLSHGLDVDRNNYPDLAVGSYMSGEAVLLRSQPVLRFHADLRPGADKLQPTDKQFKVNACLKYFGRHLPDQIAANIVMKVESRHVVCAFDQPGGARDNFAYTRSLAYDAYSCDEFTVLIKSEIYDFTQPIKISMSYNISSDDPDVAGHTHPASPVFIATDIAKRGRRQASSPFVSGDLNEFCATCPVVNRLVSGQTQVTASVPFSIGCGADGICQSDLSVTASISGLTDGVFVIGSSQSLDFDVDVMNVGEPASLPEVEVQLPHPLRLVRMPLLCTERERSAHIQVRCQIRPHPFPADTEGHLRLTLDTEGVPPGTEVLTVQLNVTSSGEEVAAADNVYAYTLRMKTEADIAITGQPVEEQLYYDKQEDRDESEKNDPNYVIISHRYQVLRYLASPVEAVNVSFLVPVNVTDAGNKQIRFLDLYRPKAALDGRPLACSIETGYYLAQDGNSFIEASRTWRRRYQLTVEQRRLLADSEPEVEGNATTVLNCSQPFVSCVRLECPTVAFPRQETHMVVTLSMRVKIHELEPYVGSRDSLIISTVGMADLGAVPYPLQPLDGRPDVVQVHTILLPSSLQPFPVWIIVVTVIGSLLLLGLITFGLYKAGFFKRRRPETGQ